MQKKYKRLNRVDRSGEKYCSLGNEGLVHYVLLFFSLLSCQKEAAEEEEVEGDDGEEAEAEDEEGLDIADAEVEVEVEVDNENKVEEVKD